jgi:hypothetical protein
LKTQPFSKKDPEEIDDTVQAFLNLRPDGFALNVKKQEIAILEFTRAMDTDVQWEVRKDAEKRHRYAPVLDFFSASQKCASWKMLQINFTVGVRGSISTADILERVGQWTHSFVSSLERLGVSRKLDIERTRKAVAKRTFEAHDLMLRSYFAVKFSPSGHVDVAKIRTNSSLSLSLSGHGPCGLDRPRTLKETGPVEQRSTHAD